MGKKPKTERHSIEVSLSSVLRKSYTVYTESYEHVINFVPVSATLLHMKLKQNFIIFVNNQLDAQFLLHVCIFLFSTCFGQPCAHHRDN